MQLRQAACTLATLAFGLQAADLPPVRILDWNINKGQRLPQIIATIRAQEPDIVLLQEVDSGARRTAGLDITREIAERVGMNHVFSHAFEELGQKTRSGKPALHGQGLLSRFPVISTRVLTFAKQSTYWEPKSCLPNSWAILRRRTGGRIAQVVELDANGTRIVVYNLHLESRGFGGTREAQLAEAMKDAEQYGTDIPVVVGGDLNTVYSTKRTRELLRSAGFRNCFGDGKVRTHRFWGTLDWLAVRGPINCENASVVRDAGGSDHRPLTARIRLAPKTSP